MDFVTGLHHLQDYKGLYILERLAYFMFSLYRLIQTEEHNLQPVFGNLYRRIWGRRTLVQYFILKTSGQTKYMIQTLKDM